MLNRDMFIVKLYRTVKDALLQNAEDEGAFLDFNSAKKWGDEMTEKEFFAYDIEISRI